MSTVMRNRTWLREMNEADSQPQMTEQQAWSGEFAPRKEAAACMRVARATVGVESMRQLIAVTGPELLDLEEWAREEPSIAGRIAAAIKFRADVLRAFDELAAEAKPR